MSHPPFPKRATVCAVVCFLIITASAVRVDSARFTAALSSSLVVSPSAFDLSGSGATFALFVVARRIVSSPFGLSLLGVRENVRRMPAIGIPVTRRLIAIYTASAALAGEAIRYGDVA